LAVDYRDWGFDSRDPRERRSADEARPRSWEDYTGESGPHRADLGGTGGYPSGGSPSHSSGSYSSGSIYRGRRRQQDEAVADDRPYGRRSARTRWQHGDEDSTGTFSRYEEPDDRGGRYEKPDDRGGRYELPDDRGSRHELPGDRGGRHASGWSPEVAPTSGWTPSSAPTSGWVGAASTSEWTREAYTGEWARGDFTGEWQRDTGEPIMPSRSDGGRRPTPGGRRRATPDWRELPDEPSAYDQRPAVPPQRDSFTDTSEWVPPRGEQAGEGQASRPQRPDWAVGLDPSSTGRRRRSWQDQTEARWPSTRSGDDRPEEPSGAWSSSAPVSGLSGTSGRAEVGRSETPAARLSEDDPRWVGIPSSAPRSPAVAFPDEPDFDYDDRPGSRSSPTTFRDGDRWGVAPRPDDDRRGIAPRRDDDPPRAYDDAPTTYRAPALPRARAEAPATDWRAPAAAPDIERGVAQAPTRTSASPDWRAATTVAGTERAVSQAPSRAAAPAPAGWRAPAADGGRERALGAAVQRVATPDELDDEFTRAPGGAMAAILATLAWYAVPLLLFAVYTVVQGEESQVLGSLSGGLTRFAAALAVSLVVAVLLRWVSSTWRSISVGLAAAVVGGGLSTVLLSAISGQPLGG
jgi:hypothetical protein